MKQPNHYYRVTKYNPKNRDQLGRYLDQNEWTEYRDFSDPNYSFEKYLLVENAYIYAIYYFIEKNKAESFQLYGVVKNYLMSKNSKLLNDVLYIEYICRINLRNLGNMGCKVRSENMCVHFGSDYYMFLGSNKQIEVDVIEFGGIKIYIEEIDRSSYPRGNDLL